ncbi:TetR/AcrR family transcriptional regulator [Paenibacillus sp. 19GGS1-52]|uniref:TetR/AcrR family transcriptional regulator n=1 Tax=Paenibacillus sp. 19GGS1-52 TaxID=2758563 RepID=UPI001EFB4C0C|nr:TetR/AcrR family transcriptional regulator [Paenibacillus sp. 19GGS1-52]ULO07710.1 TetR/AcrR family transcriptional regulator [Paenibacillus sp. 19GGS1-52]
MGKSLIHTKEGLVLSTIEVINDIGINNLSIRKVAMQQGVSEGAIFRHYKSKNELLLAVLDYYSKYDSDVFVTVQLNKLTAAESIHYCFNTYATYYENYSAITAITQIYEVLRYEPELRTKIDSLIAKRMNFMKGLIDDAITNNEIDPHVNSEQLATMMWGDFREICMQWRISELAFSLRDRVHEATSMFLDAFSVKHQ